MKENCYQTLSVAEDATADVISAAYKALAKLHHPDSGTDKRDWKLMAKINEAFETLKKHNYFFSNLPKCCKAISKHSVRKNVNVH